ncbi:thiamine pyrophosphate-dependent enzyme [Streptomyces variegatus]|uniref:thiamine pyrophosphate-dependent enzyme n=1 Tax=Streptomyces variegatus TaxID=284040 RepID=UPI0022771D56|nr:thiamine pyrophosphate-dependent enzyme [Streptomyces variegatus]
MESRPRPSWPRCTAGRRGAAAAAAGPCTCSTRAGASTAATPSSPADSPWPPASRSPTACANGPNVTCCFFGDGAFAEGEFHETANLAALWKLPLLLVCENNLYAMGTALERHEAQTDLAMRAASYGMVAWAVDGMDAEAVEGIRAGTGPHFLELRTYRFRAHSMYDPDRYRHKGEIEQWKSRDPVSLLMDRMRENGELGDKELARIEQRVTDEIDHAVEAAEQAPEEPVGHLLRHVTSSSAEAVS